MTNTLVVIAYDGFNSDPLRWSAYYQTLNHLKKLRWPFVVAMDSRKPYSLAQAVNRCVRNHPCGVFVLNYADVIVPLTQIQIAVGLAREAPGQVFAFDEYLYTERDGEELVIEDAPANACMAIQRDCFLEVGGYDETFVGWAMEDREFNDRCGKHWEPRRVPGRLVHLWHGDRREDGSALETSEEQVAANWAHYRSL